VRKKTIIHFIYNLGRGGAETMLVRVIKELNEYRHIVVTIHPKNSFGKELICDKLICFNLGSLIQLPLAFSKFRRVVRKEKPDIVHTHLFWPTFFARYTVSKRIPLITTVHAFIASSVEYTYWYVKFLDKLSYKFRKSIIIVVAKGAMDEYFSFLKLKPYKAYTLYTFVDISRFKAEAVFNRDNSPVFSIISVGALRVQKNYRYIIEVMGLLKDKNIELHIYGEGDTKAELERAIKIAGARVELKGQVSNIETVIPRYDLFLMPSKFEGFSLSVLEAMAMGMPLLLSDIPSFKEQCDDTAIYFPLNDITKTAERIIALSETNPHILIQKGAAAKQRVIDNFTLEQHIFGLRKIYNEAVQQ